jgi:hypothetical protein
VLPWLVMTPTKQILIGIGIIVLVALGFGSTYIVFHSPGQQSALPQNTGAVSVATATTPSITINEHVCDAINPDSTTGSYSVDIRTDDASIATKQQLIENLLHQYNALISSSSRSRQVDPDAGLSTLAQVQAMVPLSQASSFISKLKASITTPEYAENEYSSTLGIVWIKQTCQSYVANLKSLASAEVLYLSQLSSTQASTSPEVADSVTQKLTDTRQSAISYQASLDSLLSQINQVQVTINVKQIPG